MAATRMLKKIYISARRGGGNGVDVERVGKTGINEETSER